MKRSLEKAVKRLRKFLENHSLGHGKHKRGRGSDFHDE